LTTILAVVISLGIVVAALPEFNQITRKQIDLPFHQFSFWLQLIVITLITGLLSGSYPALFLSSFKPVKVLKGALKLDPTTTIFRKGLVVFQFVLSVILITGTIIISRQMNYIQSKNLGYNRENLISVTMDGELRAKYDLFKNELLKRTDIKSVSRIANDNVTDIYGSTAAVGWTGQDTTKSIMFTTPGVGYDFFQTMQMKLVAGRAFSKDYPTDTANYILNETAVKETGYKDPIGQPLRVFGKQGKIIGVVKDFHFHSMHTQIGPMIFRSAEHDQGLILIRTQPGKSREAVASIENLCKELNPAFPPSWSFVDEQYQKLYQNEQVINKLSDAFAFLAIFISCLGLLGLAMFTAEQRIKEIGIRKVLGASIASLFALLSKEFVVLVTIALLIATPVTWYAMDKWLHSFQYYAPLSWWVFAVAGILTILIALATVSFQAIKAALVNPVKSLRSE
jgi:ABC-type antimicrobial peptide transport system permease subunit